MKKKSAQAEKFMEGLHSHIVSDPQFRRHTIGRSERQVQAELRPLVIRYLEHWFNERGYADPYAKANKSFYWEGQEGEYGRKRETTFGSRNYPDFIVTEPYRVAIEYKQSDNGSTVKHGIGQSIMHTLSDEFDYVYYLFHDESKDNRIHNSIKRDIEAFIIETMWRDCNVFIRFV